MARSSVWIGQGRYQNINGIEKLQAKIAAIPEEVTNKVKPALDKGADLLVAKVKSVAPVSDLEAHPGDLQRSVHKEPGRWELSVAVVVDAKDAKGETYPAHVEYGHRNAQGGHVPPVPFFWPAYNVTKKKIRSTVARAMNAGVKAAAAKGGDSPT